MNDQAGFDFSDDQEQVYAELMSGGWLAPKFTTSEYRSMFERADAALQGIVGPARPLLAMGVAAARAELAKMLDCCARGEPFELWRVVVEATPAEVLAFVTHCTAMAGVEFQFEGIEYKTRENPRMSVAAICVADVGSIVVRTWPNANIGVDFKVGRDLFFLHGIDDDRRRIYAPESVFAGTYCADKLANANDGVASVPTFTLQGREYINGGGYGHNTYHECQAWTFRPVGEWRGPTYSYRTQHQAVDAGRIERSDRRGLIVSVRGQLAVIDGSALVYDDNAGGRFASVTEADIDSEPVTLPGWDGEPL